MENVVNKQKEIKNVSTQEYMPIENLLGYEQFTNRTFCWMSSRWNIEKADNGFIRIRNIWQLNYYMHIENLQNPTQYGTIYPS